MYSVEHAFKLSQLLTVIFSVDRHYGMNRFNRRTVREDIPIARIVQTDEEIREQNERFQQLQALRAQWVMDIHDCQSCISGMSFI